MPDHRFDPDIAGFLADDLAKLGETEPPADEKRASEPPAEPPREPPAEPAPAAPTDSVAEPGGVEEIVVEEPELFGPPSGAPTKANLPPLPGRPREVAPRAEALPDFTPPPPLPPATTSPVREASEPAEPAPPAETGGETPSSAPTYSPPPAVVPPPAEVTPPTPTYSPPPAPRRFVMPAAPVAPLSAPGPLPSIPAPAPPPPAPLPPSPIANRPTSESSPSETVAAPTAPRAEPPTSTPPPPDPAPAPPEPAAPPPEMPAPVIDAPVSPAARSARPFGPSAGGRPTVDAVTVVEVASPEEGGAREAVLAANRSESPPSPAPAKRTALGHPVVKGLSYSIIVIVLTALILFLLVNVFHLG